jgi:hypothetical protein
MAEIDEESWQEQQTPPAPPVTPPPVPEKLPVVPSAPVAQQEFVQEIRDQQAQGNIDLQRLLSEMATLQRENKQMQQKLDAVQQQSSPAEITQILTLLQTGTFAQQSVTNTCPTKLDSLWQILEGKFESIINPPGQARRTAHEKGKKFLESIKRMDPNFQHPILLEVKDFINMAKAVSLNDKFCKEIQSNLQPDSFESERRLALTNIKYYEAVCDDVDDNILKQKVGLKAKYATKHKGISQATQDLYWNVLYSFKILASSIVDNSLQGTLKNFCDNCDESSEFDANQGEQEIYAKLVCASYYLYDLDVFKY